MYNCDDCYKLSRYCNGVEESDTPMNCYLSVIEATENPAPSGQAEFALLASLKPFAEAAKGMAWESTPDDLEFWPVNSLGSKTPLTAGDMRRAMELYAEMSS